MADTNPKDGRRDRFRAILEGDACVYPGSVFDAITARMAEEIGFETGILGGSVASWAVLGVPDIALLTLPELAEQCRRICRHSNLPLLVDADHGYGNALSVMRTVEELEAAGVAAITIEDTLLPAAYGAGETAQLISIDEGAGKLRAALAARRDPKLAIVGRTSSMSITSVEDTIARMRAYEATGVDAIFLNGVGDKLDAVTGIVKLPLILGASGRTGIDLATMAKHGVRIANQGHAPFMAAMAAARDTLQAMRDGNPPSREANRALQAMMKGASRDPAYAAWSRDFMGG